MSVIEEYWSGVLRRLQAEVDVFNKLIQHNGVMGQENELALARILGNLIPRRYGVGSGLVIDARDESSQQTDIIVYDQADEPAILAQSTHILFPIESVRACIEVKTSVEKRDIDEFGRKMQSLQNLSPLDGTYPLFAMVGYHAGTNPETLADNIGSLPPAQRPDLICILETGMIGGASRHLGDDDPSVDTYELGLALLPSARFDTEQGAPKWLPAPEDALDVFERDGVVYPVVDVGSDSYIAEPSRALLLFCEALVSYLAERRDQPAPMMSRYLTDGARQLLPLRMPRSEH